METKLLKKLIVFCLLAVTVFVVAGCNEERKVPGGKARIKPIAEQLLPFTDLQKQEYQKWVEAYGDGPQTQYAYNLKVLITLFDNHGGVINGNRELLRQIAGPNDPNSLASEVVRNKGIIQSLVAEKMAIEEKITELDFQIVELKLELADMPLLDMEKRIGYLESAGLIKITTTDEVGNDITGNYGDIDGLFDASGHSKGQCLVDHYGVNDGDGSLGYDGVITTAIKTLLSTLDANEVSPLKEGEDYWVVFLDQNTDYAYNRWNDMEVIARSEEEAFEKAIAVVKLHSKTFKEVPFGRLQATKLTGLSEE